jgi:nucleoid-associated protein YgaU
MSLLGIKINHLTVYLLSIVIALCLGCAGPPLKQIKEAENALNIAHQKEAHLYVAEHYVKAKEKFVQAQKELEKESYRKAKSLAQEAKEEAELATSLVEKGKRGFAERAKEAIAEAKEKWGSFNHAELKRYLPELFSLAGELLEKAESANDQGDFYPAWQNAREFLIISEEFLRLPEKKKVLLEKEIQENESLKIVQKKANEIIDSANRDAAQMIEQAKKEAEGIVALAKKKANELWAAWLEKRFPSVYAVKKGETLADISAKKLVYGDPYLWPLLYKANRDQIRDPQNIFPGQKLSIPRELSSADLEEARKQAGAPPGYTPPPDAYDPSQYQKELVFE